MTLVLDVFATLLFEAIFHHTGDRVLRLLSGGRWRGEHWANTQTSTMLRSRRDHDGTLHVGAMYVLLVGIAVWLIIGAALLMLENRV